MIHVPMKETGTTEGQSGHLGWNLICVQELSQAVCCFLIYHGNTAIA
ncbi:hypothetical protein [Galbibacter sp.]|nr:hypothetical protein [Galbibacter sp.]HLV63300.1 hypothetical protein [Galbibacter sp.]